MTIKDIAKAAGVSVTTVSKILNHKDENISEETRQKVLAVVEQNQFVPYAKLRNKLTVRNEMVGIMLPEVTSPFYSNFLQHLISALNSAGYAPVLYTTNYEIAQERTGLKYFSEQRLKLVLLAPSCSEIIAESKSCLGESAELFLLNFCNGADTPNQYFCDYLNGAMLACEHLLLKGCRRTALLLQKGNRYLEHSIREGYLQTLSSVLGGYDESLIIYNDDHIRDNLNVLIDAGINGIICQDIQCASKVYQAAAARFLSIPKDLSVIALEDCHPAHTFTPELTVISYSSMKMAHKLAEDIIKKLSPKHPAFSNDSFTLTLSGTLTERSSIRAIKPKADRILVAGHLNMDIVMKIPHSPTTEKPLSASQLTCMPGGKGGNQAVAVAKSGGNACMIGTLGNDLYGKQLYEKLMHAGVDTSGVTFCNTLPSGTAYISLLPDGNSLIIGNSGANEKLDISYLKEHLSLFEASKYCLLQMETSKETFSRLLDLCVDKNIKPIVKPNKDAFFPPDAYAKIHMLIPNLAELEALANTKGSVEAKALALSRHGTRHIIVTLGENGCLWVHNDKIKHFPSEKARCVDATGASDVFIGYLATLLTEGSPLETAIEKANYAAGLSVAWEGVQNAIPERRMIDNYFSTLAK